MPDLVAAVGAGLRQLPLDAFLDQSPLQACELPFVVDVRLPDPALHVASADPPAAVLARHGEPGPAGPEHDVGGARRLLGGRLARHRLELRREEIEPLARHGRDRQRSDRVRGLLRVLHDVRLGADDERTPLRELGVVGAELLAHGVQVGGGVRGGEVDHEDEGPASRDVTQEPMAEALAPMGALDQSGDVGHHEPLLARLRDAEVGRQGRERVVGDLRCGRRQPGQERGLPCVRQAHQTHVGDRAELQRSRRSSPSSPASAVFGTRFFALANRTLPRPPRPPRATTASEPSPTRSARRPCSSKTTVPSGT